ncbi:MAG: response regulator [Oscillospiraceae bacterium]|nr:response regulator [Oscillospiraceae bacterium]
MLFVFIAFQLMVAIASFFVSSTLRKTSSSAVTITLEETEKTIRAYLREPKVAFDNIYTAIQDILDRNESPDVVYQYLKQTAEILNAQEDGIEGFIDVYGYIQGDFISGADWVPDDGYIPQQRPWYQLAVRSTGVNYTAPYIDAYTGLLVIALTCEIYGKNGDYYGVLALDIDISWLTEYAKSLQFVDGGYGMIVNQYLHIIAHPQEQFKNTRLQDLGGSYDAVADMLRVSHGAFAESIKDIDGTDAIVFFKQIYNGWYIGIVMPNSSYYADLYRTFALLTALGFVLACILSYILIRLSNEKNRSEEESRAKSSFLSMMSHEMRTPMNAIIGMTAIGKSASDIERKNYSFIKIEDASNHLLGVINDILDMSKIEAGKFDISPEEFNFEKMLQRVMTVVNYKIIEKKQKFKIYVDRDIPEFLIGDDQRLTQVITNLVGNAVKFTPEEGSIRIGTYFLGEKDGICSLKITVTDNGIGISPEQQNRLFKAFQQAESSTSRKFGGTGLGLIISKNIVEMMGGRMWVESELGKGAVFAFTVQLKQGETKEQALMGYNINWSGVNILLVDDDTDTAAFFKKITGEFGAACDTVSTGEEALGLVREKGRYDVYFIGGQLSDMSGVALVKAINEIDFAGPESAFAMFFDISSFEKFEHDAVTAGVDAFVSKPFFPSQIINTTNDILGLSKNKAEKTAPETEKTKLTFKGRRILLAEDVEINREIVLALLEPALLEIDCAENGAEAVRMFSLSPEKYDMILMDIQMPEMDGFEAARTIRALKTEKAGNIPIVAMTANVFKEDIEECFKAGMNDHIGKPLDFNAVLHILEQYLS